MKMRKILFYCEDEGLSYKGGDIILTPHPGEMATLTRLSAAVVEANRLQTARKFAMEHDVHVLLKGHRQIIVTPKGRLYINPHGNDALDKGGSGDILTGLITSYTTQGSTALEAMQAASYFHARAVETLGKQQSHASITAMDLLNHLANKQGRV